MPVSPAERGRRLSQNVVDVGPARFGTPRFRDSISDEPG